MKAGVFDPYLDTLGGGEVYTASVIEWMIKEGYVVDLFWKDPRIVANIRRFLGIDLHGVGVSREGYTLYSQKGRLFHKWRFGKNYNTLFFVSDGSIPFLSARNNILHFQIPFTNVKGSSFLNQLKLKSAHHIVCNSFFTKKVVDAEYKVEGEVIYPPINIKSLKKEKENLILSVGRFTTSLHNKRQDVLIQTFKELINAGLSGWSLLLIGSTLEGKSFVETLTQQILGYPIKILTDVNHNVVTDAYAKSKIFWHAAGVGIDEVVHPEMVEHFGIATAEAMSSGCVPIVIDKGGQPEIVKNGTNGYLWSSTDELRSLTLQLIKSPETMSHIATNAKKASQRFSKPEFSKALEKILNR